MAKYTYTITELKERIKNTPKLSDAQFYYKLYQSLGGKLPIYQIRKFSNKEKHMF